MKKDKNEVDNIKKETRESKFIRSKRDAIIESFNHTIDAGKAIWELPVVNQNFMNLASGTIYGPANATFLHSQMRGKREAMLIAEYRKHPVLNERMEKIIASKDLTKVLSLNNELIKAGLRNKKIQSALDEVHESVSNKEIGPYFLTWNQGKNIYDFKGGNKFYVLHKFFYDVKGKSKEDEPNKDQENPENNEAKPENTEKKIVEEQKKENEEKEEKEEFSFKALRQGEKVTDLFNRSQIKVLPGMEEPKAFLRRIAAFEKPVEPEEIKTLIQALTQTSIFPVMRTSGKKSGSFYDGGAGVINVPPTEYFKNDIEELHTIAHEIAHSYGGAAELGFSEYKRFQRDYYKDYSKDIKMRAAEELIANVTAGAFLNAFNIKSTSEDRQSAFEKNNEVYDIGWATALKESPNDVVKAIEMAEKVVNQMTFLVKKELKLMFEKNPSIPLPSLIKEELESQKRKEELDPEIANDYVPRFKDEEVKSKIKKPEPYRRGQRR